MKTPPVRHYCTLFDRNYLVKGLALYQSLERCAGRFVLHILCMDDLTYDLLSRSKLAHARLIRRVDFEDPELLAVKPTRTVAEYCWTCTPSLPLYVLDNNPAIDLITYLDADLWFFASPEPVFDEFGGASTLIVEHRFTPRFQPYEVNGKYNVEWLTFRRDAHGLETLRWWREKCIEWCFYRVEPDRMGDQKYLDTWPQRFAGVHVLQHLGAGVAPWNFAQYKIEGRGLDITIDGQQLIFYHFHGYRCRTDGNHVPIAPAYLVDASLPELIYAPYQEAIAKALRFVRKRDPAFAHGFEAVEGATVAADAATRAYWGVPESVRNTIRRFVPSALRSRVRRALGLPDQRGA